MLQLYEKPRTGVLVTEGQDDEVVTVLGFTRTDSGYLGVVIGHYDPDPYNEGVSNIEVVEVSRIENLSIHG